ncbi:MAG: Asp-tRNA(Asn)/Glu-tRNA(Gln) amidotransferase subunit GatB [Patescibacteria group bacterium]|jgi:aspartyl-tRNA(Asn)/glutamyl-tRNA(Gln) amidotransferase subunit B
MSKYETIIGLEIHLQLKTKSKMFCACSNDGENQKPNTTVCPICLGHPGTLPVVNKEAIKQAVLLAVALGFKINKKSKFDRKNYFYPDLPKGYQISQFDEPLASDGRLIMEYEKKKIRIGLERLHVEEDSAKNIHNKNETLVDFNRAGTPLAEIVTRPDFREPAQAKIFLQELKNIVRYLGVSDADMEKGHLRCDANISLRPKGDLKLYPKTEIKNMNSFKAVEKALHYEVERQTKLWEQKKAPKQTATRGWDDDKQITVEQRTKEGSSDYRYFPEPDLPPLIIDKEILDFAKQNLPELPLARQSRFQKEYGLNIEEARFLVNEKFWSGYYEQVMSELRAWLCRAEKIDPDSAKADHVWDEHKAKFAKLTFGWLTTELFKLLGNYSDFTKTKISPENMAELVKLVYQKKINSSAAQSILAKMYKTGDDPSVLAEKMDLAQIDDAGTLEDMVMKIIMLHPEQTDKYRSGKIALLQFFVGLVMKESKGKANPKKAEEILKEKLK